MTERTSSLCVSHAMQGFMQREVTVGMEERMNLMSDGRDSRLQNFFNYFFMAVVTVISQKVGAGQISTGPLSGQRCRPFVCTFCVFGRGIKPLIVKTL